MISVCLLIFDNIVCIMIQNSLEGNALEEGKHYGFAN